MSIITTFLHVLLLLSNFAAPALAAPTPLSVTKRSTLSGSPVVFGAGTYPRATRLSDGSLLGVYTAFSGGNNVIATTTSTDNGASWQTLGEVASGSSNANDIDNPYVLQLPNATGRVLCAFRNHSKDPSSGAYTYFRITITYSDDKGKTWKYLSTACQDPGPVNGNLEPFLRLAQDGSLQIYYSRENSAADQDTIERFSTDGGQTWTSPKTISGTGITSRDGMTGVADVSGSNLMAVFESETNGIFNILSITSADDGKTWSSTRSLVYVSTGSGNSAGAPQIINVGGTMVVSFMTSEDADLGSGGGAYTSHTAAKAISSSDGGKTWGNKITTSPEQSVWPGLVVVDSKSFLALSDHAGAKAQKVTIP